MTDNYPRSNLADWNLEAIKDLVNNHAYEPGIFDFKEALNAENANYRDRLNGSIVKTVCAMANSGGGYVIFGVTDRQEPNPEDRIVGIPQSNEHRADFARKLSQVQPPIFFDAIPAAIPLENDNTKGVFVVHVPLSPRRPHMVRDKGVFYRRGTGGTAEFMDYYQVRDQMLITEARLRQVRLLRLKLAQFREQCRELIARDGQALLDYFGRFETDGFESLLAEVCPLLPAEKPLEVDLLSIPPKAQAINRLLDLWHHDFGVAHQLRSKVAHHLAIWANKIHGEARMVDRICGDSILALRNHFGPLEDGNSALGGLY